MKYSKQTNLLSYSCTSLLAALTLLVALLNPLVAQAATLVPGDFTDSIQIGGLTRTYLVHVPTTRAQPSPMVLCFHGLNGNGSSMELLTGLNAKADSAGFVVVYPDGYYKAWNDGGNTTSNADDVGFISALIEKLVTQLKIDRKRIYACGASNGAFFSQRLAFELSNKVAAVAMVAGGMFEKT